MRRGRVHRDPQPRGRRRAEVAAEAGVGGAGRAQRGGVQAQGLGRRPASQAWKARSRAGDRSRQSGRWSSRRGGEDGRGPAGTPGQRPVRPKGRCGPAAPNARHDAAGGRRGLAWNNRFYKSHSPRTAGPRDRPAALLLGRRCRTALASTPWLPRFRSHPTAGMPARQRQPPRRRCGGPRRRGVARRPVDAAGRGPAGRGGAGGEGRGAGSSGASAAWRSCTKLPGGPEAGGPGRDRCRHTSVRPARPRVGLPRARWNSAAGAADPEGRSPGVPGGPTDTARATGRVEITHKGNTYSGSELLLQVQRFEGHFLSPTYFFGRLGAGGTAERLRLPRRGPRGRDRRHLHQLPAPRGERRSGLDPEGNTTASRSTPRPTRAARGGRRAALHGPADPRRPAPELPAVGRAQVRLAAAQREPRQQGAASSCRCPTTGTSRRTATPPSRPAC